VTSSSAVQGSGTVGQGRFHLLREPVSRSLYERNLFLIGTDGGGEAYAFDVSANDPTVFVVPFIGMPSDARAIADSFDSFVAALNIQTEQGQ
jgi:hypothetical protein